MNMLVDGEWHTDVSEYTNEDGEFEREETTFRNWIGEDDRFPVEADRYHLYICRACPWAHRTAMTRRLKGLEDAVSLSLVRPERDENGWEFSAECPDPLYGTSYLRELYTEADPDYTGRVTVPVLWDRERETVVNNESEEIMRILDTAFHDLARRDVDLYPAGYRDAVDRILDEIYDPINNGVYRAAFAESQSAYDAAASDLFDALDRWDSVLGEQRYLAGDVLTEADVAMFATLIRFDHVYHTVPTTLPEVHPDVDADPDDWKRIRDYDALHAYLRDLYHTDGVAETVNLDHIVRHYGCPGSPPGFDPRPADEVDLRLDEPHDRDALSDAASATATTE